MNLNKIKLIEVTVIKNEFKRKTPGVVDTLRPPTYDSTIIESKEDIEVSNILRMRKDTRRFVEGVSDHLSQPVKNKGEYTEKEITEIVLREMYDGSSKVIQVKESPETIKKMINS